MSYETTPDLTRLIEPLLPLDFERHESETIKDAARRDRADLARKIARQITAAGFGPVRAVDAERVCEHGEFVRVDTAEKYRARAESAEAALAGLREWVKALADAWELHSRVFTSPRDKGTREDWEYVSRTLRALLAPTPDREEARDE